ncbi:hypothetical protein NDU88_007077 [Pleurodeles waltl]|uniref:Ferritin n=1 Tax=Pleurodeles waltl TaxID=8319 RepID=A0AAV7VTA0_PLEWA|nr:hypothetical protein NDU88_007077 [Pleurodeles waltl]
MMQDATIPSKQKEALQKELEGDIASITHLYMTHLSLSVRCHLEQGCMALNELYTSRAEYALHPLKDRHYEQGKKAGRRLVAQLPHHPFPERRGPYPTTEYC